MSILDNIRSVAKYESKLLMRSWFYRVFLILAIIFLCVYNFAALINEDSGVMWLIRAIPSNIPYANLLFLNTGQAIIAVFLSSEFLKTDKKLDTSEVFYVHPLSNAEYVVGKIWGNLYVFFRLNLWVLLIVVIFNMASGVEIDWLAYITYFLLISIPTLIYIFGLSVALMLILKNQAITFVILLGYIAITLFYIKAKFYYLFDYMVYNLPLVKSSIVGFSNWGALVNHRCIYLLLGLGFLCVSIFLFRRLPNTKYGRYRWLLLSFFLFVAGGGAAYNHVHSILSDAKMRELYTNINNKYVHTAKMVIDNYDIKLNQHPESISSEVEMKAVALEDASVFTFCLNPGLKITGITENGKELSFDRENQIILVDFGRRIANGENVSFVMKYEGVIYENFCYLDIPAEVLQEEYSSELFNIDKKYSFQTKNYLLLTPETYWYPRPGTSFSTESADWQQVYFSNFRLTVKTLNGLQALSQGSLLWPKARNIVPSPIKSKKKKIETQESDSINTSNEDNQTQRNFREGGQDQGQRRPQGDDQQFQGQRRPPQGEDGQFQGQRRPQGGDGQFQGQRRPQGGDQFQGQRRPQGEGSDSIINQRQRRPQGDDQFQGQRRPQGEGGDSIMNQRQRRPQGDDQFQGQRRPPQGEGSDSIREQRRFRENLQDSIVSERAGNLPKDSLFIFETDFPAPSLSLIIGDYEQKSVDVDGTEFAIWHLRGHNYFYPVLETIIDTIPYLLKDRRASIENQFSLEYSYNRFSLVEVPVQFYSYARTWTQAQEKMQPEMILIPEKGCLFNNADFERAAKNQITWEKRNGRDISEKDAAIRIFNNFMWTFQRTESDFNWSTDRGSVNVTVKTNPYYIFPQFYSFKYNVFSYEWPVSNRLIEIFLQNRADNDRFIRQMNGISNSEKANLLMEKYPFKELLSNTEYRNLLDNIVALRANHLFAPAERNIGNGEYRDSLRSVLQRNVFTNLRFENLLDTMGMIAGEDLLKTLESWNYPKTLPVYIVGTPEVTRITNRDIEVFVTKLQITNDSDVDGIINLQVNVGAGGGNMRGGFTFGNSATFDPRTNRKISLAARETQQLVAVWDEAPRGIVVNTLISANLPNIINMPISNIPRERNVPIDKEGDFILENVSYKVQGEVIVDNEDFHLFELSKPDVVGLLPQWLEEVGDDAFPYSGVSSWRPPLQWTLTTNDKYYGTHVRSAYVVKNGNGSQTATWKVPVPSSGLYDLYYHLTKAEDPRKGGRPPGGGGPPPQGGQGGGRGRDAEYLFKVRYDDVEENAYINLRRANEGWTVLGTYFLNEDTLRVSLSNDSKSNMVIADAVKIVKRQ